MYLPRAFAETDLAALDDLIARDNFVTLVTVRDQLPVVSHLPVLYRRDGDHVELRGHWARANPQSRHAGPALAIVHGPHAYVSPALYPDEATAARVPTWNYAVAHLQGNIITFDDDASLAGIVAALTLQHESDVGSAWRYDNLREGHRGQLGGITGFRMSIDTITLKFKLSQNHPEANRVAVATHLRTQQRDDSRDIARLMQPRLHDTTIGD